MKPYLSKSPYAYVAGLGFGLGMALSLPFWFFSLYKEWCNPAIILSKKYEYGRFVYQAETLNNIPMVIYSQSDVDVDDMICRK